MDCLSTRQFHFNLLELREGMWSDEALLGTQGAISLSIFYLQIAKTLSSASMSFTRYEQCLFQALLGGGGVSPQKF